MLAYFERDGNFRFLTDSLNLNAEILQIYLQLL